MKGNIEFSHAKFRYPSRREAKVLRDLSLSIQEGQTIALVGPSGCGKSTCIQLLQRFYNLEGGALVSTAFCGQITGYFLVLGFRKKLHG